MENTICAIVGVGPGLGLGLARQFGHRGCTLALLARKAETVQKYAELLQQEGLRAHGFAADAADSPSLISTFGQITGTLGAPNILIYNAAAMTQGGALDVTPDTFVQEFKANVAGALTAIRQVAPAMKQRKAGTILLTGGALAYHPSPQYLSLGVGKAAIRSLALSTAQELETDGIHVATVTISGVIQPGTHFAPEKIAGSYWDLHSQPRGEWTREMVYE